VIDYCNGGLWAVKELDGGTKSKHDRFNESNLTPLRDHPEWKHAKLCCDDHSYIFKDECKVKIEYLTLHVKFILKNFK
jgi:hypothetical protein